MLNTNFTPWPNYTQEEADKARQILLSNYVNYWTGNECRLFEKEFTEAVGSKYAIALSNGTAALEIALKVIKLREGDEVIVTPRTFIASVSSVVNSGGIPIFADVDLNSGNINGSNIEKVLTSRTRAIICVHLGGWPCDMSSIMEIAQKHKLYVIEDCAQAHGAVYKNQSVGSIGHIGCWSFCQDKIMSTGGEGGMITTNDEDLWSAIWSLKDHGKSWHAVYDQKHKDGFRWLHHSFGSNYRMTEIQAAIGRIQLKNLKNWTLSRTANANKIRNTLIPFSEENGLVRLPEIDDKHTHNAFYKYYTYIRPNNLPNGWSRDRIISEIFKAGVPCYSGSCPEVYLEKAFDNTGYRPANRLPAAKELGETSLMFLVHPTLKDIEIDLTCSVIHSIFQKIIQQN